MYCFFNWFGNYLNKINDDWFPRRFASLHIDGLSNTNDVI